MGLILSPNFFDMDDTPYQQFHCPHKNLRAAIIARAIQDATCETRETEIRKEALAWIHGERRATLTFVECCSAINLNPQIIRKSLGLVNQKQVEKRVKNFRFTS